MILPGFVDPRCPLNPQSPLNRGLVSDWSVIPNSGWRGGNTFRNLIRGLKNPFDGTLINGPIFQGSLGRPGGYGSLSFDGSNDQCNVGSFSTSTSGTVCAWVRHQETTNIGVIVCKGFSGSSAGIWLNLYTTGGSWYASARDRGASNEVRGGTALSAGVWYHLTWVSNGSAWSLYVNGISESLTTVAGSNTGLWFAATGTGTANYRLGCAYRFGGNEQFLAGNLDSVMAWDRVLSDSEILQVYQETEKGNPNRFNWVRSTIFFPEPPAGGTTYDVDVSESVTVSDSATGNATMGVSVAESVTASETNSGNAIFNTSVSESVTGSESQSSGGTAYNDSVSESVSVSDSQTATVIYSVSVFESVTAFDNPTGFFIFNGTCNETVSVNDSIQSSCVFLVSVAESVTPSDITNATTGSSVVQVGGIDIYLNEPLTDFYLTEPQTELLEP